MRWSPNLPQCGMMWLTTTGTNDKFADCIRRLKVGDLTLMEARSPGRSLLTAANRRLRIREVFDEYVSHGSSQHFARRYD
jgi:hypothetical protein